MSAVETICTTVVGLYVISLIFGFPTITIAVETESEIKLRGLDDIDARIAHEVMLNDTSGEPEE